MSLIPFAFGLSPELTAENKRKSDTRRRDFEERVAIANLDPLHWHKYTKRMISEGFQPEEPELESITPTYDLSKGITQDKLALKRDPYGLCPKPKPKKAILHAPLTKEVVGSGCHAMFKCSVTHVDCERLDSVTTRLAKRKGDTPHQGGDSIPTPHKPLGTLLHQTMMRKPYGQAVSRSPLTRFTMTRLTPSHLSCMTRRAEMYLPMGRMIFCRRFVLREIKALRRIFVLSVQNSPIFSVIS